MSQREGSPARVAALKFFTVLKLLASDRELSPEVMLHVVGLIGALLHLYSDITVEDIAEEIRRVSKDPSAMEGIYVSVRAVGLEIAGGSESA